MSNVGCPPHPNRDKSRENGALHDAERAISSACAECWADGLSAARHRWLVERLGVSAQKCDGRHRHVRESEGWWVVERLTREEAMTKRIVFTALLTVISLGAVAAVAAKIIGNG
jgi:hypothetical protein